MNNFEYNYICQLRIFVLLFIINNCAVYLQHLPNPGMTANFAQSFQQQTGRPLQYVTSFPAGAMSTFGSTLPFQGFQLTPSVQPALSYVHTPQGIIINQTPQPQFSLPTASFQAPHTILGHHQYLQQMTSMTSTVQPPMLMQTNTHTPYPHTPSSNVQPSPKPQQERKVAYVQPQVQNSKPSIIQKKVDPIKALSSMASQPMTSTVQSTSSLSISHMRSPRYDNQKLH